MGNWSITAYTVEGKLIEHNMREPRFKRRRKKDNKPYSCRPK